MRAAVLVAAASGGSDEPAIVWKPTQLESSLGQDEVLVQVKACGLSDLDLQTKNGEYSQIIKPFPAVLGYEVSGLVVRLGSNVDSLALHDQVAGISPLDCGGGCAEYVTFKAHNLVKQVPGVGHEEAAACLVAGVRAYTALYYKMRILQGDFLLVTNAASVNGHIAIQLAALWGAKIIAVVNTEEQHNFLQSHCPNTFSRIINLSSEKLFETVMEETGNRGVDFILDNISKQQPNFRHDLFRCLAVHGTFVSSSALQLDPPDAQLLLLKNASLSFLFESCWLLAPDQHGRYLHILTDLMEKLSNGQIKCHIAQTFPLEQIKEAHQLLERTEIGKIIIKP